MRRPAWLCVTFSVLAAAVIILQSSSADDKAAPTIKEIMEKAHKTTTGLLPTVGKELKADDLAWDSIQKKTKEIVELSESLEKNKPPKGDKASWEMLAKEYVKQAKTLDDAAQAKDKDAAVAAQKKLAGSCTKCHDAHRMDD